MDYKKVEALNKVFAQESKEFNDDFFVLLKKWIKKSPRMCIIMSIHLPINIIMKSIANDDKMHVIFTDLPDMFIRFVAPFIKLRTKWGKISGKQFSEEYHQLYESQFDEFFPTEEEKENFKNWFEGKKNELDKRK